MELEIKRNGKIHDIQASFSQKFPFLKIEFFLRVEGGSNLLLLKRLLPSDTEFKSVDGFTNEGTLSVSPSMTVAELESYFASNFNLAVQVFRRSGNVWLETTMTDKWTLKRQNDHGREISTEPNTLLTPQQKIQLNSGFD